MRSVLEELVFILGDTSAADLRAARYFDGEARYRLSFVQVFGDVEFGEVGTLFMDSGSGQVVRFSAMLTNTEQPNLQTANWYSMDQVRLIAHTLLESQLGVAVKVPADCEQQRGHLGSQPVLLSLRCGYAYSEELSIRLDDLAAARPAYVFRVDGKQAVVDLVLGVAFAESISSH